MDRKQSVCHHSFVKLIIGVQISVQVSTNCFTGDFYGTNDSATQMHEDNGSSDSTAEQKVRERSEFQDALHRV
jgi:hypothetical protein